MAKPAWASDRARPQTDRAQPLGTRRRARRQRPDEDALPVATGSDLTATLWGARLAGPGHEGVRVAAVQRHQRLHGNVATQRLLQDAAVTPGSTVAPAANRSVVPAGAVQRLMTSNQLIHGVGKPHGDFKLLGVVGPTVHEHSTHYKAVIAALDAYHDYLGKTNVDASGVGTQAAQLDALLNDVKTRCYDYLRRKEAPPAKMQAWLNDLVNEVAEEKRAVWKVAKAPPQGQTWRQAIGGFGESGGLVVGPTANVEVTRDPGLETTFAKSTPIYSDAALTSPAGSAAKGDLAVRHDTSNPKVAFVEKYTLQKPEGGGEPKLKFLSDGKGFVAAAALKESKFKHEAPDADTPLFTRKPCVDDINQQAIGDCFLLAAIGAIVEKHPDFVYGMMRDDKGTPPSVTVRLFDITQTPPQARFLQLQKSVISHDRRSSGALWVPMLEKAYAALGVVYDREAKTAAKGSASYAQLGAGGFSDVAFAVLTGQPVVASHEVKDRVDLGSDAFGSIMPWSLAEPIKHKQGKYDQMASYKFFAAKTDPDQGKQLTDRWMAFLAKSDVPPALQGAKRIEAIETIFTKGGLDQQVGGLLLSELVKMFPGKRGTGRYSTVQLEYLQTIVDALEAKRYVALGTRQKVAKKAEGEGRSAREEVAKGLVGSHAYTVLSVRSEPATGRKFVRIRNPWGDDPGGYGRVYKEKGNKVLGVEQDKKVLKERQSAVFELELSDLTKRFERIYVGG